MAPRITAKDLVGLNFRYEFAKDIFELFPAGPEHSATVEDYALQIKAMFDAEKLVTAGLRDGPYVEINMGSFIHQVYLREQPMFSDQSVSVSSQYMERIPSDGIPRNGWGLLADCFSEVSRCLNRIDSSIEYKVHRTHRKGFRVPIGRASYQRTDCGQYIEVIKGGVPKPFVRWPIRAVFHSSNLLPASREDYLAAEILSLAAQINMNFENDPEQVEGDQECICLTLHGQFAHFSFAKVPELYIKSHNSGKPLEVLEEVKVILSPEYDLTTNEGCLNLIRGCIALCMHLHPHGKKKFAKIAKSKNSKKRKEMEADSEIMVS